MATHSHDHAHDHGDDFHVHPHVAPALFYWGIFGGLIFLTFVTVGVSYVDLGSANTIVAVLVATMKASLVAAFFMHLAHDKLFNTVCLISSFAFLLLFFFFTYEDVGTRAKIDEAHGASVLPRTGEIAPGGISSDVLKTVETADKTAPSGGHGGHGGGHVEQGAEKPTHGGLPPVGSTHGEMPATGAPVPAHAAAAPGSAHPAVPAAPAPSGSAHPDPAGSAQGSGAAQGTTAGTPH